MTRIRVALLPSTVCIAGPEPVLKIKDQQTGEVATDRETSASLYTVTVMLMEVGRAGGRAQAGRDGRAPQRTPQRRTPRPPLG
ncbi:hypothetical protein [Streptomyces sp. NPDC001315]|uniref:hypothetical protein n=1 Tax=Streptomyces sp. NPDC001315 TaxID=3364562 RepID=UPI00367B12DD